MNEIIQYNQDGGCHALFSVQIINMNKQVHKQKMMKWDLFSRLVLRALYKIDTPSDPYYLSLK